jgi:subtilisin family serine protease
LSNSALYQGTNVDINVTGAWMHATGNGIRVAVIDDGVDLRQANTGGGFAGDLAGALVGSHYDAMPFEPGNGVLQPKGNDIHGTAVAGIVAMRNGNGIGGRGVAPNAVVSAVRIFRGTYNPGPFERAPDHLIADAINWAWSAAGAHIINNSWGGGSANSAITQAVQWATTLGRGGLGTVVVFSAGNPSARHLGILGNVLYPANLTTVNAGVISVGAINAQGSLTDYTPEYGPIDLVAPSGHITGSCIGDVFTTETYDGFGCNDGPSGNVRFTSSFSGTSASAPQVAGAAALLLEREPSLTAAQVKWRLKSGASPWPGFGTRVGAGLLNVLATLFPPPVPTIIGPTSVPASQPCSFSVQVSGGAPPFVLNWSQDGQPAGSGGSVSITSPASGSFAIDVVATDQNGGTGSATLLVAVDPWMWSCPF